MVITKKRFVTGAIALGAILAMSGPAMAEEGSSSQATEKVQEAGRDVKKSAKKAGRKVKDETCELVNGKMECAAQKVKHGVQNASDEVKDTFDADKN